MKSHTRYYLTFSQFQCWKFSRSECSRNVYVTFKNLDSWADYIHIIMVNHTLPGRLNPKAPSWITQDPKEIEELIIKYAKDDLSASQIGVKLRDQHSIPLVKPIIKRQLQEF